MEARVSSVTRPPEITKRSALLDDYTREHWTGKQEDLDKLLSANTIFYAGEPGYGIVVANIIGREAEVLMEYIEEGQAHTMDFIEELFLRAINEKVDIIRGDAGLRIANRLAAAGFTPKYTYYAKEAQS